ncbi:hypothetical protein DPMN_082424 [Dreissena polymorpha]|uniref:Uncharacterized protein n=1 Tax=Dreissena polymorpha TaxID=45954 RepID=A0A9D3Y851_DREPO|nr:hypothetical protein DPMN_082424 [Dreissena polymorpha]
MNRRCIGISSHCRPIKTEAEEELERGIAIVSVTTQLAGRYLHVRRVQDHYLQ